MTALPPGPQCLKSAAQAALPTLPEIVALRSPQNTGGVSEICRQSRLNFREAWLHSCDASFR